MFIIVPLFFYGLLLASVSSNMDLNNLEFSLTKPPQEISMRFATATASGESNLVHIYLYQSPADKGELVTIEKKVNVEPNVPNYVMFNGHPSTDSNIPYEKLRTAIFQLGPANIFSVYVDWNAHSITFLDALVLAKSIGQNIADILISTQITSPHFIAHCAGAEVAMSVAQLVTGSFGTKIPRLTIFDPFISNKTTINLSSNYFDFVDVYHAGIYVPPFPPIGNIDFYPNAGMQQPGCEKELDVRSTILCHHRRSIYLYIESITQKVNAVEAIFDMSRFNLQAVGGAEVTTFGFHLNPSTSGAFYLPTLETAPYLINYF